MCPNKNFLLTRYLIIKLFVILTEPENRIAKQERIALLCRQSTR